MNEPFAILGIAPTHDCRLVRAAFRQKAALLHPDQHGNSVAASERFKGIVKAYEAALRLANGGSVDEPRAKKPVTTPPPPGPIRERFACPRCDDTFPVADTCPRCDVGVTDTWRGERVAIADDPRIAELIARLERGPRFAVPELPIPDGARPFIASGFFLSAAYMTASIGLPVLGFMLGAFGLAIGALEVHERATRPARVRLFIF
jgi:hypothetical protein